jgi:hypothetical protein
MGITFEDDHLILAILEDNPNMVYINPTIPYSENVIAR